MSQSFDIVIVGAGVVGLTAAIAMQQRDFSVAVIDASSLPQDTRLDRGSDNKSTNLRVYAVNQASQLLLQTLNVWPLVDPRDVSFYSHMHVWDAKNKAYIDFDARMVGSDQLGAIIEEAVIKNALIQKASAQGITFFPHSKVTQITTLDDGVTIHSDSSKWHARLLIVADGAASVTRELLGVPVTKWPYHQHALVATVHTEKSHQHTAFQVFNHDGPLAFLPMVDSHQCSIVWSTTAAKTLALIALPDLEFNQQLAEAFAGKLGACEVISPRQQFPLFMRHATQYVGSRWLLMGDAAHTIHPLAGLGLNIGLADVSAWVKTLDNNRCSPWAKPVLGSYQRQRKHAVWQNIVLMDSLKAIFANPLPPIAALRGLGLTLCNNSTLLKRFFIEQAAG